MALPLGLMVHELSTNAAKYGAHVDASRPRRDHLERRCRGRPATLPAAVGRRAAGPPVRDPTRKGFGSSLITRGIGGLKGGVVTLTYPPEGVACHVEVWLSELCSG